MKVSKIKKGASVVSTTSEVTLEVSPESLRDFREALATVTRYKDVAMKATGRREQNADWTMVNYLVDGDKVVVTIEQGMAG